MQLLLIFFGIFTSLNCFSTELCGEPKIDAKTALNIISQHHSEHGSSNKYILGGLSFSYIECSWKAVYSVPEERFPAHHMSYVYTFTNENDIQLFKF